MRIVQKVAQPVTLQLTIRTAERSASVPVHRTGQGMLQVIQNYILPYQFSAPFLVPEQVYRGKAFGEIVIRKQFDVTFQKIRCTKGNGAIYTAMFRIWNVIIPLYETQTGDLSVTRRYSI